MQTPKVKLLKMLLDGFLLGFPYVIYLAQQQT